MTPTDIALLRTQFAATKGKEDLFASLFYARLFRIAPELRPLFGQDIHVQSRKLMAALALAVNGLDRPESLRPALHTLGARHAGYGVTAAMFAPVGRAMLDTLADMLGPALDEQARQAWQSALGTVAAMMTAGLAAAREAA
ncbi:globin domain-containing protein [Rubellimicrobium arenae]|uniref:globin domain-containing protein n=1 Tax=Rubellimicrobium arenae TaxID=2817372 RepID=UPI001B302AE9|nr:globin domain-containing protein [Rubellimicrobium arenae]